MTKQIDTFQLEIRFLRHFIALCETMIRGRREDIRFLKKMKFPGKRVNCGFARAKVLSPERRKEIAKKAAEARWKKL